MYITMNLKKFVFIVSFIILILIEIVLSFCQVHKHDIEDIKLILYNIVQYCY